MAAAIRISLRPTRGIRIARSPDQPIRIERLTQDAPQVRLSGVVVQQILSGPGGVPVRIEAPAAATWILVHGLGRTPLVQVFLASGEKVIADVFADSTHITVTHASPIAGYVLAY